MPVLYQLSYGPIVKSPDRQTLVVCPRPPDGLIWLESSLQRRLPAPIKGAHS